MEVDILLKILGAALLVTGIIFSVLPVIPGQILAWGSLLMLQLTSRPAFSESFIVTWALITAAVSLLDYYVPIWGTKRLGGSKRGVWGATIGLVAGIFLGPYGLILGPFAGAFIGELTAGKDSRTALRSGFGSFIGFLTGVLMKLAISLIMGYHFVVHLTG